MSDSSSSMTSGAYGSGMRTLSAMFDTRDEAERAMARLSEAGIPAGSAKITGGNADTASTTTAGDEKGFFESLGDFFFPAEDRYAYAEGLARGGYLLTVSSIPSEMYDNALDILDDEGSINIDERETMWRSEGWAPGSGLRADPTDRPAAEMTMPMMGGLAATAMASPAPMATATAGFAENRTGFGATDVEATETALRGEDVSTYTSGTTGAFASGTREMGTGETVQVIAEQLRVGKRETSHGRVRVRSYVVEEPASADVELSRERVTIERHAVDRPLTGTDDPFRDQMIEAEEFGEEAVIGKEARVVEEIGLRRERDTRTETVSDTVRRTEVEIEDERDERGVTKRSTDTI